MAGWDIRRAAYAAGAGEVALGAGVAYATGFATKTAAQEFALEATRRGCTVEVVRGDKNAGTNPNRWDVILKWIQ